MKLSPDGKLEPIWYALGGVLAVPFCVVMVVLGAVLLLVTWPFAPFVMYRQRKKEIAKALEKTRDEAIEAIKRGGMPETTWRGADL